MEEKHHNSPSTTTTEPPPPPSSSDTQSTRRRGGFKRKASNLHNNNSASTPPQPSSKRQTREKPSPVLFPPIHNGPLTRARLQPNYADTSSFWEAVDVNEAEGVTVATPVSAAAAAAKVEEELIASREAWEALEAKIEAEFDVVKSRGDNVHVVPVSAGWFSWTEIHPLEEKALPSFFNGKFENRTREQYLEIRNSIMKRFHENPKIQIEEKDLSEISVGELDAKKEVLEFLDYWGLINYHPLPEADTVNSVGDNEEAAKVKSLIQKLYEFDAEQLCSPVVPRSSIATPAVPYRLPESIIFDDSAQPEGPSVEYHCNSCAADCSRKRYHCQKQADFDLCTECFNEGKFDSDMSPSDFILMEPGDAAGASSGTWTDQETLLLLEALQLFNENWNEIAEHVATKTKAQCILHFLQMPIEDTFRDCDDEDEGKKDTNTPDENGEKKDAKNPDERGEKKDAKNPDEKGEKKDAKNPDENGEKKDAKNPDENGEKKDAKKPDENGEKKEVGKSQQENDDKMDIDKENDDSQDTKETKDPKADNDQPSSCPMEISESVDNNELKDNNNQENGVNIAVKALREAFDAVGSLSSSDEKLCFADAGNPVMAMAAFLTRLVKPNIATATARTSLKSVSNGATGMQLSARHSFLLEDPTDETKKADDTDRDVQKVMEHEDLKEKTDSCNKQEEEKAGTKVTENENETQTQSVSNEKKEDAVTAEVAASKKVKNGGTRKKGGSSKKDKDPVTEKPVATEEVNMQTDIVENSSGPKKETQDSATDAGPELGLVVSEPNEAPKDEEMAEKTESPPSTLVNNTPNSGDAGAKDSKDVDKKPLDTVDDPVMHKLTRAAVTAISAAAVKAKFLADQEEDQIRQLVTSLVEKQLHKLETKLTFFSEMDGVVSRAREQLERSKQRLYQERAQIIAARLGMSGGASSRPMAHPLQRPPNPMAMAPQRPPLSRPMMGPTPPFSNPMGPAAVAGNPTQISSNQAMK